MARLICATKTRIQLVNALRWTIGIITTLVAGGFFALAVIGGNFRRSFGASDNAPWMLVGPPLVAALILASLVWPERRVLLHVVAVIMIALCIGCAFLARETVFTAFIGLCYAGLWLAYYYRTVWATTVR